MYLFLRRMLQDPGVFSTIIQGPPGAAQPLITLLMASHAPQLPPALARSGTLSKLISWGEASCAQASDEVGP